MKYIQTFEQFVNEKYNFLNESLSKAEFIKKFKLSPKQYTGDKKITKDIRISKVKELPEDFSPKSDYNITFSMVEKLPDNFKASANVLTFKKIKELPEDCILTCSSLKAPKLTKLPSKWNENISTSSLQFNSLKKLPSYYKKWADMNLTLPNIESLPNGFKYKRGSGHSLLDIRNITKLPKKLNINCVELHMNSKLKDEVEDLIESGDIVVQRVLYYGKGDDHNSAKKVIYNKRSHM